MRSVGANRGRYLLRRVIQLPFVLLFIAILNFTLIRVAPGDPASVIIGEFGFTGGTPTDYLQEVKAKWGLTKPLPEQLGIYLANLARGDLGFSYAFNRPVADLILERLPATLLLLLVSEVLALILGTIAGTLSARLYPSKVDTFLSTMAVAVHSVPVFWSALVVILVFAVYLRVLPTSGMFSAIRGTQPLEIALDVARHMVLPCLVLILYQGTLFFRVSRASVLEVMNEQFMTTARSKGVRETVIFFRHALPNALLPVVTIAGLIFGGSLAGAVFLEAIFGWPGVGRLLYQSILLRDYPLVMGILTISSISVVLATLITDLLYARLDPRIAYE
jgi:peptide/nickel transport system permease protein